MKVAVYVLLFALSVPWYWPKDDLTLVLGFPAWALASLFFLSLACGFTAWNFLKSSDLESTDS